MRFRLEIGLLLTVTLALTAIPAQAANSTAPDASVSESQAAENEALSKAFKLLYQGKAAEAEPIFSAIIARYDQVANPSVTYRCASDPAGSLSVLLMAAADNPKQDVVALGPNWCDALFGRGFALIDLNRPAEAGPFLAKAVEMDPLNPHYLNEYAEWFKSQRLWQRSFDLFEQAWEMVSHDKKGPKRKIAARSLRGMAFNLIELGKLDRAEKLFKQSLEYEPEAAAKVQGELDYITDARAKQKAS